jgi:NTE family protein
MKQKVSLVLSGGGARGIAHIGVIEELEKSDFEIASIAGTSMGALVGGVYSLNQMEAFKNWMVTLDKGKVFSLVDFTLGSQGLVKGDRVLGKMKEFISDGNIEDLEIPYAAIAADIINKKEIVFRSGSIYEAIRASIAIPSVLTPVKTKEGLLVDGGIINNIPISQVQRFPNDILVVVNVNANIPSEKPILSKKEKKEKQSVYVQKLKEFQNHLKKINPIHHEEKLSYFEVVSKTINLMTYHQAQTTLERYNPDLLINISRDSCTTYDFFKAEELIEIGRLAANKVIREYKDK